MNSPFKSCWVWWLLVYVIRANDLAEGQHQLVWTLEWNLEPLQDYNLLWSRISNSLPCNKFSSSDDIQVELVWSVQDRRLMFVFWSIFISSILLCILHIYKLDYNKHHSTTMDNTTLMVVIVWYLPPLAQYFYLASPLTVEFTCVDTHWRQQLLKDKRNVKFDNDNQSLRENPGVCVCVLGALSRTMSTGTHCFSYFGVLHKTGFKVGSWCACSESSTRFVCACVI